MRVRYVKIQSYRGLADVEFPVGDSATLVGKNDAGKSSILEALHWFFWRGETGPPRKDAYTWHDFGDPFPDADAHPNDSDIENWGAEYDLAEDLRITIAFGDVKDVDLERFRPPPDGAGDRLHRLPAAMTEDRLLVLQRRYFYRVLRSGESFDPMRRTSQFLCLRRCSASSHAGRR